MPYPAAAIANAFLALAEMDTCALTHMQLQKLVYFNHGWHLGLGEGPLSEEHAQAWEYGPVFPSLYQDLKRWGKSPVEERIAKARLISGRFRSRREEETLSLPADDSFAVALNERIWNLYGRLSGFQLSAISHEPKGPWASIRKETIRGRSVDIPNQMIEEYFANQRRANS